MLSTSESIFFFTFKINKMSVVEIRKDKDKEGVEYQTQCPETEMLQWHWVHYSNLSCLCDEGYNTKLLNNASINNLIDLLNNYHYGDYRTN